jgi:hypothetical protein
MKRADHLSGELAEATEIEALVKIGIGGVDDGEADNHRRDGFHANAMNKSPFGC